MNKTRTKALKDLLQNNSAIWCASETTNAAKSTHQYLPTGFDALDSILPMHGWPSDTLVEIILPHWGTGELQLLLPALVAVSKKGKWISWISPPYIPYAPALAHAGVALEQLIIISKEDVKTESLWAMEKVLRNPGCGIAMSWPQKINDKAMRRLQLAAQEGKSLGFIFRDYQVASSPATLRISLKIVNDQLQVELLKARGMSHCRSVLLDLTLS